MTVDEVLKANHVAFSTFTARAMDVWTPIFRQVLGPHEGATLADAHQQVLAIFDPANRRPSYPVVSDYFRHLPGSYRRDDDTPEQRKQRGTALDTKGHAARKASLLNEWRAAQGQRVADGVPEVMQALALIAADIAHLYAWRADSAQVRLTRRQIMLAQSRAISLQRVVLYGPAHKIRDPGIWWEQIQQVAALWRITFSYDDWQGLSTKPPDEQEPG